MEATNAVDEGRRRFRVEEVSFFEALFDRFGHTSEAQPHGASPDSAECRVRVSFRLESPTVPARKDTTVTRHCGHVVDFKLHKSWVTEALL